MLHPVGRFDPSCVDSLNQLSDFLVRSLILLFGETKLRMRRRLCIQLLRQLAGLYVLYGPSLEMVLDPIVPALAQLLAAVAV